MKSMYIAAITAGALLIGQSLCVAQVVPANQMRRDASVRQAGCSGGGCAGTCGGGTVWGTSCIDSCIPQACGMKSGLFAPCPNPCRPTLLVGIVSDLKCAVDTSLSTLFGTVLGCGASLASGISGACDGCGVVGCEATCGMAGEVSCGIPDGGMILDGGITSNSGPIYNQPVPHSSFGSYSGNSTPIGSSVPMNTSNFVNSSVPTTTSPRPTTSPVTLPNTSNSTAPVSAPAKAANPFSDEGAKGTSAPASQRQYRGAAKETQKTAVQARVRQASFAQKVAPRATSGRTKPRSRPNALDTLRRAHSQSAAPKMRGSSNRQATRSTYNRDHLQPILRFRD